jgi:hypothetical protein
MLGFGVVTSESFLELISKKPTGYWTVWALNTWPISEQMNYQEGKDSALEFVVH